MRYGMVWHGMAWYGVVWGGVGWCGVVVLSKYSSCDGCI